MQTAKNAAASAKEAAANLGASAKSGLDKTKAVVEEKMEKMTAQHPAEKAAAEQHKQEKICEAEVRKREAMEENAAAREQVRAGYYPSDQSATAAEAHLYPTAAMPGQPAGGYVESGVAESRPIALETGTGRPSAAHNPRVGSQHPGSHGTGTGTGYT